MFLAAEHFAAAEHFVRAPDWQWWILAYFFVAGIAGGSYVIGTILRLAGGPGDLTAARVSFIVALVATALCPAFLTIDLGRPERFWHMLVDNSTGAPAFSAGSPMSVGAYALLVFGIFAFVSALDAWLGLRRTTGGFVTGPLGAAWMIVGSLLGLFIAAYTGVLLAVSNQPVWSDAWPLGGLFLASGLSGAAALLALLAGRLSGMLPTAERLEAADRLFVVLEAVLIVVFIAAVVIAGTVARLFSPALIIPWLLVLVGLAAPWALRRRWSPALAPATVLLGVLALRAVVVFGGQY